MAIGVSILLESCTSLPPVGGQGSGTDQPVWEPAFDTSDTGALSAVWGSSAENIFVVGGTLEQGEVYHFDGTSWKPMEIPQVPLLAWVFGFGDDTVYAVGKGGGVIRYDGVSWSLLTSGTEEDLWGVWGGSRNDIWIVGGTVGDGDPVIIHFDGSVFQHIAPPSNDRGATSLFKVWGIGSTTFAVGENGLILQYLEGSWSQVFAGASADDDFVSLWGTGEDNIVAVGGRGSARIARYNGESWQTEILSGTPGLNAVFMVRADAAVVGGTNGYVGVYNPMTGMLSDERSFTNRCIHGMWGDSNEVFYAVGGHFTVPFVGTALVRR